jgi:predicted TIM-barrel fold metal-dependent hydrolase
MTTSPQVAVDRLEELALQGFVGVRFNPYLRPDGIQMSDPTNGSGLAVYKRCAELHMPVGIMCFKGLELHYEDILALILASPDTVLILDHVAFTGLDDHGNQTFQECLLPLAKFPNVVIKVLALFRVAGPGSDPYPYKGVRTRRFHPLLKVFGADRLMFSTDFPYVLEQESAYKGAVDVVQSSISSDKDKAMIMGGTAERLFGPWDSPSINTN